MKLLIVLSTLVVIVMAQEAHDSHQAHDAHGEAAVHTKCQSKPETHVDEAVFEKLRQGKKPALPENFGKHMICMAKGLNMMNEDGKVNVEGVKTHVKHTFSNPDIIESLTTKCAVDKETPEKTAIYVQICMHKHHVFGDLNHGHSGESSESESNEHHHHHH